MENKHFINKYFGGEIMFQSEIRPTQVNALLDKVSKHNYGKYLYKVYLSKVRSFTGQRIKFDFPVTALIGPNGGGKTTILGAAACIYKEIRPRQFFARNGQVDNSMQDWRIEYELIDRTINPKDFVRRTASFGKQKWSRDALNREVAVFGVTRTVPAVERVDLLRFASNSFSIVKENISGIEKNIVTAVQRILGKDISQYTHIRIDDKGKVSLLAGKTSEGVQYSEFHFGAGESSIIRMVMKIESLSDNSLILIEEIENGLHPVATARMVEYLIDVAERKKTQVIFSTHSNDALLPLPSQAIWATINGKVFQGKLDIHALRAISGQIEAELAIFTEDVFSAEWMKTVINSYGSIDIDSIEVHPMAGDGMAVSVNKHHNIDPSSKFPSVCYLDGDSAQKDSSKDRVFRLPGECPESYIYDKVIDALDEYSGILAVSLHRKYEDSEKIVEVIKNIRLTNMDDHLLYSQVGKRLGLIPENIVRSAFLNVWTQAYPEEVKAILLPILDILPVEQKTNESEDKNN